LQIVVVPLSGEGGPASRQADAHNLWWYAVIA